MGPSAIGRCQRQLGPKQVDPRGERAQQGGERERQEQGEVRGDGHRVCGCDTARTGHHLSAGWVIQ